MRAADCPVLVPMTTGPECPVSRHLLFLSARKMLNSVNTNHDIFIPIKMFVFPSLNNRSLGDVCGRCMGRTSSLQGWSQALQLEDRVRESRVP